MSSFLTPEALADIGRAAERIEGCSATLTERGLLLAIERRVGANTASWRQLVPYIVLELAGNAVEAIGELLDATDVEISAGDPSPSSAVVKLKKSVQP